MNSPDPSSVRFRITVAYDGTAYAGWQIQPGFPTVQQTLEKALATITGQEVKVHGSGRTDRGVHARGQVAHFDAVTRMSERSMLMALNSRLPEDIRILACAFAPPDFHARRSAIAKEYRYTVWNGPVLPPQELLYAAQIHHPLDVGRMREGAARFLGEHDFVAFMANPQRVVESTVRTIHEFDIAKRGRKITFRVKGTGFLYKQVRGMVGLLLRIGADPPRETPDLVTELLDGKRPRTARVPSAPPQGLTLWRVWY